VSIIAMQTLLTVWLFRAGARIPRTLRTPRTLRASRKERVA
jgi:hypothetical protein